MLVEPAIQVNLVVDAAAPEPHARHLEIGEERDADPQVGRGLLGGEAARRGERQRLVAGRCLRVRLRRRGCFLVGVDHHSGYLPR
jgi:hypothetical protein